MIDIRRACDVLSDGRWPRTLAAVVVLLLCAAVPIAQNRPASTATKAGVEPRRAQFLDMFARAYFPGRNGQIMIVPREGDIITRNEPDIVYMHGSPWGYDVEIPVLFSGPAIRPGTYATPAGQQDVAVTIARSIGTAMPPASTGRVPSNAEKTRAVSIARETSGVKSVNDQLKVGK